MTAEEVVRADLAACSRNDVDGVINSPVATMELP